MIAARTPTTFRAVGSLKQSAARTPAARGLSTSTIGRLPSATKTPTAIPRASLKPTLPAFAVARSNFSTTAPRDKSVQDKDHPNSLWYHTVSGNRIAVTHSSTPPSSADSPHVMASFESKNGDADPISYARENPDDVHANKAFWDLLHKTLKEDVVAKEKDELLQQEADLREDGWAHLAGELAKGWSGKRASRADHYPLPSLLLRRSTPGDARSQ